MKTNCLAWRFSLLLLFATTVQLFAQAHKGDQKLFEQIKAEAEKGDAQAQYWVSFQYWTGVGVTHNQVEAAK